MATRKNFDLDSIPSSCSISGSDDEDYYKKPAVSKRNNNPISSASKTSLPLTVKTHDSPISTNTNSPKSARYKPGRSNSSFASSLAETPKKVEENSSNTTPPKAKPRKVRGGGLRKIVKEKEEVDTSNPFGSPENDNNDAISEIKNYTPKNYSPKILNPKNFKPSPASDDVGKPPEKKKGFNFKTTPKRVKTNKKPIKETEESSNPFGDVESDEENFDDSNPFGAKEENKKDVKSMILNRTHDSNPFGDVESDNEKLDKSNPFGNDDDEEEEELDENNPFAEKSEPKVKSQNPKQKESSNPFGSESEEEELDENNPFAESETKKEKVSSNPFGDPSSDEEYPNNKITPKNSKIDTYDRSGLNPFGPEPKNTPEAKLKNTKSSIKSPKHRAAPKLPNGHKPHRPPPPSKEKLERRQTLSSDGDGSREVSDSGSSFNSKQKCCSTKQRSAPSTPVAPPRPNESDVDIGLTEKKLSELKFELENITNEMEELEPVINEPRPSKFSETRWAELLKRQGDLVLQLNDLQLRKELYEVCEQHRKIEYEMRVLASKSVRTVPEEQRLDNLGMRLQRIINQKMQIDEQLNPAGPEVDKGMKKKKKSMLKGFAKKLTIKK